MRKLPLILLLTLIAVMAIATFVEKYCGTTFSYSYFYGSWWFTALWTVLATGALVSIIKGKIYRNIPLFLLHISFILILAGALCTKLWAVQGTVTLQQGEICNEMRVEARLIAALPFTIELDTFRIEYYAGTDAPADYISQVRIDGARRETVSMNNILTYQAYRFYQSSFEADGQTSILSVNRDVAGIPITYAGYALFALSMFILGIGKWRKMGSLFAFLLLPTLLFANVDEQQAADFGKLSMLYDGRIAPVSAFAHDFTLKLNGKTTASNCNAEQVLMGFLFFPEQWEVVAPPQKPTKKQIEKWNNKMHLISVLHTGKPLKLFPLRLGTRLQWYSPTDNLPAEISAENAHFIRTILSDYYLALHNNDEKQCAEIIRQIKDFQQKNAADVLPSESKVNAELFYLKHDFVSLLFKINLMAGVLCLFLIFFLKNRKWQAISNKLFFVLLIHSFVLLTVSIALRAYIGGRLPLFANGFETMQLMAWCAMLGAIVFWIRKKDFLPLLFGLLMSGCTLLVAHLGMMNPRITPLMPVLSSPLLSLHVSSIMIAYTLLAFTALNSLLAIITFSWTKKKLPLQHARKQNLLCIFPAVFFMGVGIFIGAVWANISWGRYWAWDPKETWALITFLVYGILLHQSFAPRNPFVFHIVCLLNFLTVLMTYFGVNYFLGGMHGYV
jgi:ABC-type transport system involved in cytochrome c biogenesis permease subunit